MVWVKAGQIPVVDERRQPTGEMWPSVNGHWSVSEIEEHTGQPRTTIRVRTVDHGGRYSIAWRDVPNRRPMVAKKPPGTITVPGFFKFATMAVIR